MIEYGARSSCEEGDWVAVKGEGYLPCERWGSAVFLSSACLIWEIQSCRLDVGAIHRDGATRVSSDHPSRAALREHKLALHSSTDFNRPES
jgi:hypothetical protein